RIVKEIRANTKYSAKEKARESGDIKSDLFVDSDEEHSTRGRRRPKPDTVPDLTQFMRPTEIASESSDDGLIEIEEPRKPAAKKRAKTRKTQKPVSMFGSVAR
ncbi:hypothetical protein WICPIJ_009687, partial [Wickerhamomyces pijperi]